jgi:hypothetical protein
MASNIGVIVDANSAITDSSDTLIANVGPVISIALGTADAGDTLVANVAIGSTISVSSTTTDAPDILAASVSPSIAASSANTDGADSLNAQASPVIGISGATTDAPDVLSASVSTSPVAFSGALQESADILVSYVIVPSSNNGDAGEDWKYERTWDKKKRARQIIKELIEQPEIREIVPPVIAAEIRGAIQAPKIDWEAFYADMGKVQKLFDIAKAKNDEDEEEEALLMLL